MAEREHFTNGRCFAFAGGSTLVGASFSAEIGGWPHWITVGLGYGAGAVLMLLSAIWITKSYYSREDKAKRSATIARFPFFHPLSPQEQEPILNKHFSNEIVDIDGKHFAGCTFVNVKFRYNGASNFSFTNVKFDGSRIIASDNPGVESAFMLATALGLMDAPLLLNGLPIDIMPTYTDKQTIG